MRATGLRPIIVVLALVALLAPQPVSAAMPVVGPDGQRPTLALQAGDVIIAVDGLPVRGAADLRNRIGLTPIGRSVDLTILREGARRTLDIRIEQS
jgi:S1-C subfamily serine protease